MVIVPTATISSFTSKYLPVVKKSKLSVDDKMKLYKTAKTGVLNLFQLFKAKALKLSNGGFVVEMKITPEIARLLIAANPVHIKNDKKTAETPNRALGATRAKEYSTQMKLSKWKVTGDSVRFSIDGTLIDGQHRLEACIKGNITFNTLVIFNLPTDTMEAIDIGKSRDDNDLLKMKGYQNHTKFTASIKFAMMYNKSLNRVPSAYSQKMKIRTSLLENEEVPQFLERIGFGDKYDNTLYNNLTKALDIRKANLDNTDIITPSKIAVLSYLIEEALGKDISTAFIKKVYTMYNFVNNDPLSMYRNTIINLKTKGQETTMHGKEFRYLIRAWNQFISGETPKQLSSKNIEHAVPLITVPNSSIELYIDKEGILQRKFV